MASDYDNSYNDDFDESDADVIKLEGKKLDVDSLYLHSLFDKIYPVGSIYISAFLVRPDKMFGGEWIMLKDRFLVGAGNTYTVTSIGGSTTHTHTYGIKFGGYYKDIVFAENSGVGLLNYNSSNAISISGYSSDGSVSLGINNSSSTASKTVTPNTYRMYANASYTNSTPPTWLCICGKELVKKDWRYL